MKTHALLLLCSLIVGGLPAAAQCPPSCPVPGGGPAETDCHAEFATSQRLNYPAFDPTAETPEPARELRCFDGDAGCDLDGTTDLACTFDVDVCLHNADPALPGCTPDEITAVQVEGADSNPDLAALQAALDALLPADSNVCTDGQTLRVPLAPGSTALQNGTATVHLQTTTAGGAVDEDDLTLTCVPREWPTHGYDQANTRASATEKGLSPANAAELQVKWQVDLAAIEGRPINAVSSVPTVGNGLVYFSSWNGIVYAVDEDDGSIVWRYDTQAGFIGSQSTPTLTADGRVLVGDSTAHVHCLDAASGRLLWKDSLDNNGTDHIWASPAIANGRVFIGIASHSDNPCTKGRLLALDLDTGEPLWSFQTVPDRVCQNDTSVVCESDADCGGATCVEGRGAGVTATVALDPTGEVVYMDTVGCYTYPSIGDSDSMFRFDAASGDLIWKTRVQPPEQFGYCAVDSSIDCGTDAFCPSGTCQKKGVYHDFGFLNGPILADVDEGGGTTRRLVISGSKDGTLYAFDPADGSIVWKNIVVPTPVSPGFAGYGLFNGAIGFADQHIFAAINETVPAADPPPPHLRSFAAADGSDVWMDEIGNSWSSVAIANDVLLAGSRVPIEVCEDDTSVSCSNDGDCPSGSCVQRSPLYIYDARNGERLATRMMPDEITGGASVVSGDVYVPYGVGPFGLNAAAGGVVAFTLPACLGDCNRDRKVAIDELTRGVGIALNAADMSVCPRFDGDDSGDVSVDELVRGVGNALHGCD
jgi:outer membrane protein assembly factor BamB